MIFPCLTQDKGLNLSSYGSEILGNWSFIGFFTVKQHKRLNCYLGCVPVEIRSDSACYFNINTYFPGQYTIFVLIVCLFARSLLEMY